ncbi:hypothetical protein PV797_09965 [Clostridiaceae bacterium M8S5]|nr:hypothetical protein PV797_09965 [Clostridiaceae bacterium M8S5]
MCSIPNAILTSCVSKEDSIGENKKSPYNEKKFCKDVELSTTKQCITQNVEKIKLIYNNLSNKEYNFGKQPHLEININNEWLVVPTLPNRAWNSIAHILKPRDKKEQILYIKDDYGILKEGNYRIVKELFKDNENVFTVAEFSIINDVK